MAKDSISLYTWLSRGITAVIVITAGLFGYSLLRADLAADVYLERLQGLAGDYEHLRSTYNEAITRTAVTELIVHDGKLSVRVRNAAGVVQELDTPYDPTGEIYVDYVVVDGRLLIRRIFDESTRPADAMVVDAELSDVDWGQLESRLGKAVYRALGEGRWVVTVTTNGSLDLVQAGPADTVELVKGPPVRRYDEIERQAKDEIKQIGPADVFRRIFLGKPADKPESR